MLSAQLQCPGTGGVIAGNPRMRLSLLYMLEEQARPSVPSNSDEPLGATTLHAAIGGSTMDLLHSRSDEGMEAYHAAYVASPTGCPGCAPVQ